MANNEFIAGVINGSPCGCAGCEKWADCDYCGTCTPEDEESDYDEDGNCKQCGMTVDDHDRSCGVGYEEWCARVDLAYGEE